MSKNFQYGVAAGTRITDLSRAPRTYNDTELNAMIDAVARALLKRNIPANSSIAIIAVNSVEYAVTLAGIRRAGHIVVPINYRLPADQIKYCLQDSDTKLVFCDAQYKTLAGRLPTVEFESDFNNFLDYSNTVVPAINGNLPSQCFYTSGSTGPFKGVLTTYNSRMWAVRRSAEFWNNTTEQSRKTLSVTLCPSPFCHLAGVNWLEFNFSTAGAHLIISAPFNARNFLHTIAEYRPTALQVVAPVMPMLLKEKDLIESIDLSSVLNIRLTSSAAPEKLQRQIRTYFNNSYLEIENPYGLTEIGGIFGRHPLGIPRPTTSVGYPAKDVDVRLVDGVLQVKSPGLFAGYKNKITDFTDDGYFITKDVFRVNKYGFYFYVGRADDMFKSGGEKVYPKDIESVLEQHPSVESAAVIGLPDDIKGHKAYAFVKLNNVIAEKELIKFSAQRLATYQIPRNIWTIDDMPLTTIGKIDKKTLTQLAEKYRQSLPNSV